MRTYVVPGLKHEGTSLVAGLLRLLGIDMGSPQHSIAHEDGRLLGRDTETIRRVIRERNERGRTWGWKDPDLLPRLSLVYDLLVNPRVIVIGRDGPPSPPMPHLGMCLTCFREDPEHGIRRLASYAEVPLDAETLDLALDFSAHRYQSLAHTRAPYDPRVTTL